MALTNEQLESRIILIETRLSNLETAILNVASIRQLKSIQSVRQQEIIELKSKVETLESQVALLQSDS